MCDGPKSLHTIQNVSTHKRGRHLHSQPPQVYRLFSFITNNPSLLETGLEITNRLILLSEFIYTRDSGGIQSVPPPPHPRLYTYMEDPQTTERGREHYYTRKDAIACYLTFLYPFPEPCIRLLQISVVNVISDLIFHIPRYQTKRDTLSLFSFFQYIYCISADRRIH